jgi:2-oxoglutarate dehydrogenase E1 component
MLVFCGARYALGGMHSTLAHDLLQEEPLNNGAWSYIGPRIFTAANKTEHFRGKYPSYAGRGPTSSVATGSKVCFFYKLVFFVPIFFGLVDAS